LIAKIDCIPCILDDVRGAIDLLTADEHIKRLVMKESLEFMSRNMDLSKEPSTYITEVHRIIKRITGIAVPFEKRRWMCNELGMKLSERLEERIKNLDGFERFSHLARWSIAGNALDFRTVGTGYDFDMASIEKHLNEIANKLDVDLMPQIYKMINSHIVKSILFIHDNVGEIALDKLLIQEIQDNGVKVISAVRGGPITSDATVEDALQVKLHEAAHLVIIAGPDTLGISFDEMSQVLKDELSKTDMVIAKGQANFYIFSEHKHEVKCPIACLFRTKCRLVWSMFGGCENMNVAVVL